MPITQDTQMPTWDDLYGRPLSEHELNTIQTNLCAYFDLLNEWHIKQTRDEESK